MWNKAQIQYWCEHYYELRNYELNPFSKICGSINNIYVSGEGKNAPYIETCDLNWEFDKALMRLSNETEFRRLYLDGYGQSLPLFNEFCRLLEGE